MNKAPHLRAREVRLLDEALDALTRATGFKATLITRQPVGTQGARPDAVIQIDNDGKRLRLFVEIKMVDRAVALAAVKDQLAPFGKRGVLVAPYLTAELANYCRNQLDLQFIDTTGNAYLRAPGLYVFVKGEKPQGRAAMVMGTRGGGTTTALRIVFAILCKPELLNAPYRDIVEAAGVALGAIGWVFFDLEGRGYVARGKRKRDRRLIEPMRLLEEWVTNYPIKLRPKLTPRRFRAPAPDWWHDVRLAAGGAYWGGEVAADRLTAHLKPATVTIYVEPKAGRETLTRLVAQHRLRADPEGDVEILDAFWNFPPDQARPDVVPPILVYADLVATLDPRNIEVAKMVRERYIDNALRRA